MSNNAVVQPWMAGFDEAYEAYFFGQAERPSQLPDAKRILNEVGVFACPTGDCDTLVCSSSYEGIKDRLECDVDDAIRYIAGAFTAAKALTESEAVKL
jgi:hypothetical protein